MSKCWTNDRVAAWTNTLLKMPRVTRQWERLKRPPLTVEVQCLDKLHPGQICGQIDLESGDLLCCLPTSGEMDKARMLWFLTHEIAHMTCNDWVIHGPPWRWYWLTLTSEAIDTKLMWPQERGRPLGEKRARAHFEDKINTSWRRPPWARSPILKELSRL